MNIGDWVLLGATGIMAAGLVYLKVLVLGLQTELRRLRRRLDERPQAAAAPLTVERAVESAVEHAFRDQMRRLLEHTLDTAGPSPEPPTATAAATPPSPPVRAPEQRQQAPSRQPASPQAPVETSEQRWNPERRFRIIAMAERGEQPERIAAALQIPVSEVELFLRVHQIART